MVKKRKLKKKPIFLVIIILLIICIGGFLINKKTNFVSKIKDEFNEIKENLIKI